MRRRELFTLLGGATTAAAWRRTARAQQPKVPRIGYLGSTSADSMRERREGFRAGLRDLGYQEGRDIVVEYRWADGDYDRLPALLADLIGLKVDVLVTHGTPGVLAAKQATSTIPIVIAAVGDALASGLVSSLARPGGNVTGSTFFQPELLAKRIELIKDALPHLRDMGVMLNPANPMNEPALPQVTHAARSLNLELHRFNVREPAELDGAFAAMAAKHVRALVVFDDAVLLANPARIAALASQWRVAACGWPEFAAAGGLLAYGVNLPAMFRRAATYVDKILKGADPGQLPVERTTKFETVVNLKTAKALGIELPTAILLRADQVIE